MGDQFISALYARDRVRYGKGPDTGKSTKTSEPDDTDTANDNYQAYARSRDAGHSDWLKIAKQCDSYFLGEQWEKDTADTLDSEGRPHVTINQVLSTVNAILSEHVRRRQEITFLPRGNGATEEVSKALSFVTKQIQDNNQSKWVEQQVVADGIIEDRGYFDMRISFEDNIFGEVRETAIDPRDVLLDPAAKEYDPRTWNEVIRTRWLSPDEIAVMYGEEKADQLRYREIGQRINSDSIMFDSGKQTYGDDDQMTFLSGLDDHKKIARIRIIERQHRVFTRCKYFVDPEEGDMRRTPEGWDDQRTASFALAYGLDMFEKPERRIRWTTSADDVLLYDDWSLYNRFTIIPFFPFFRRGRPSGLVRHLISPQDMLNKITSQELHVVNTTANSGWIFESGSLVNMDADDLEKVGAKTGLVIEFKKGSEAPEKIQPNQIPSGLDQLANKAQVFFRNVSGISETMTGQSSREVSGVAVQQMNQSSLGGLEIIWDNLAKTRQYRADFMLELVQQWYTERRLIKITELDEDGKPQTQEMAVNDPQEPTPETPEGAILRNLSLGEYTVVSSSLPARDSLQDTEFAQMIEMRQAGIAVPDWAVMESSRLENKREIADVMRKVQGMAEPTPEEAQMQMQMQMLQLQTAQAQLQVLLAKGKEHEANANLSMAKADAAQQAPMLEMQRAGAEMRTKLEELISNQQTAINELQTRLTISREKNDTIRFNTMAGSMTKRMDGLVKRNTKLAEIAAASRDARRAGSGN